MTKNIQTRLFELYNVAQSLEQVMRLVHQTPYTYTASTIHRIIQLPFMTHVRKTLNSPIPDATFHGVHGLILRFHQEKAFQNRTIERVLQAIEFDFLPSVKQKIKNDLLACMHEKDANKRNQQLLTPLKPFEQHFNAKNNGIETLIQQASMTTNPTV